MEWISVKDRLPENNDEVLVWLTDGYPEIAIYGGDENEDGEEIMSWSPVDNEFDVLENVLFWTPIPEPKG